MNGKTTLAKEIESMEVGEVKSFPAAKLNSIKVTASNAGFILDRKYQCRANKENRTVDVTRVK